MTAMAYREVLIHWTPNVETSVEINLPGGERVNLMIARLSWNPQNKHVIVNSGWIVEGDDWTAWNGTVVEVADLPPNVRADLISACLPGDM